MNKVVRAIAQCVWLQDQDEGLVTTGFPSFQLQPHYIQEEISASVTDFSGAEWCKHDTVMLKVMRDT